MTKEKQQQKEVQKKVSLETAIQKNSIHYMFRGSLEKYKNDEKTEKAWKTLFIKIKVL